MGKSNAKDAPDIQTAGPTVTRRPFRALISAYGLVLLTAPLLLQARIGPNAVFCLMLGIYLVGMAYVAGPAGIVIDILALPTCEASLDSRIGLHLAIRFWLVYLALVGIAAGVSTLQVGFHLKSAIMAALLVLSLVFLRRHLLVSTSFSNKPRSSQQKGESHE